MLLLVFMQALNNQCGSLVGGRVGGIDLEPIACGTTALVQEARVDQLVEECQVGELGTRLARVARHSRAQRIGGAVEAHEQQLRAELGAKREELLKELVGRTLEGEREDEVELALDRLAEEVQPDMQPATLQRVRRASERRHTPTVRTYLVRLNCGVPKSKSEWHRSTTRWLWKSRNDGASSSRSRVAVVSLPTPGMPCSTRIRFGMATDRGERRAEGVDEATSASVRATQAGGGDGGRAAATSRKAPGTSGYVLDAGVAGVLSGEEVAVVEAEALDVDGVEVVVLVPVVVAVVVVVVESGLTSGAKM